MKNSRNNTRFCLCLGAWDWWSGRGDAKFEELFPTQRDGHNAELAGAGTDSDGKMRAIGYPRRYDVQLEQTVGVGSYTAWRQCIVRTATLDVIYPLPQNAQTIREPLQIK